MKPEITRRLIGGLAVLLGVWWTLAAIIPAVTRLGANSFEALEVVLWVTTVPLVAMPGILAAFFGAHLFREMRESSLRWVIGVFCVFFAFFLSARTSERFPSLLPTALQHTVFLFAASLVALAVYLFAVRLLLWHFIQLNRSFQSLLGRGVLILMAWQVWLILSQVFHEYSPTKEGSTIVPEMPWGILSLIVPIAVAYGLYHFATSKLTSGQQNAVEQPATAK